MVDLLYRRDNKLDGFNSSYLAWSTALLHLVAMCSAKGGEVYKYTKCWLKGAVAFVTEGILMVPGLERADKDGATT